MIPMPDTPTTPRDDRWQHLVHGAFLLDEELNSLAAAPDPARIQRATVMLESFLEVFPSSVDPVDDFEGYAIRRVLLALRRALPG